MLNGTPVSDIRPKVHSSAVQMVTSGRTTARSDAKLTRYTSSVMIAARPDSSGTSPVM